LPLFKPPYSRITAIDLNRGEILWQVANGEGPRDHPLLAGLDPGPLGSGARTCVLVTKTLLIAGDGGDARFAKRGEPILRAYDKGTGAVVGSVALPGKTMGCPMTYVMGGVQYLVLAIGDPAVEDGGTPRLVALTIDGTSRLP
jgi:quinoprotein glucose dehydrogenase